MSTTPHNHLSAHRDAVDPVAPPRTASPTPAMLAAELAGTRRALAAAVQAQRDAQAMWPVIAIAALAVGVAIGAGWLSGGAS